MPRISSAASGLRFCGMMDEPVVNASDSLTKPKAGIDHCTNSPASRDRLTADMVQAARYSSAKSRAEIASMELRIGRLKPRLIAVTSRSMGKDVPASAAAPKGDSFKRLRASSKRPRSRANIST